MNLFKMKKTIITILLVCVVVCVLIIHAAVPGVLLPNTGFVYGWTGFAEAFALQGFFAVHSDYFGYTNVIPLSFGLTAVLPMAWLIRFGVEPLVAFSIIQLLFLLLAFAGGLRLAIHFKCPTNIAILLSLGWLVLPIIWISSKNYMMLGWGMALLPGYFYIAESFFQFQGSWSQKALRGLALLITIMGAMFLDPYSLVMFLSGVGFFLIFKFVYFKKERRGFLSMEVPFFLFSISLAYLAYASYIKVFPVDSTEIAIFRAMGADLIYLAVPSQGVIWLWDTLGLSAFRDTTMYWGDGSAWKSSFSLLLMFIAIMGWWLLRNRNWRAAVFLAITIFGFYMSLGPTVKIDARKSLEQAEKTFSYNSYLMPREGAGVSTGSGVLSENMPGFRSMRGSYRWVALGSFGAWVLLVLVVAKYNGSKKAYALTGIAIALLFSHTPNLGKAWETGLNSQKRAMAINDSLLNNLKHTIDPSDIIMFLPAGNDHLLNYLASRNQFQTYNVGGDRHYVYAKSNWPALVKKLSNVGYDLDKSPCRADVFLLAETLIFEDLDVIVFPFFDFKTNYQICDDAESKKSPCNNRWMYAREIAELIDRTTEVAGIINVQFHDQMLTLQLKENINLPSIEQWKALSAPDLDIVSVSDSDLEAFMGIKKLSGRCGTAGLYGGSAQLKWDYSSFTDKSVSLFVKNRVDEESKLFATKRAQDVAITGAWISENMEIIIISTEEKSVLGHFIVRSNCGESL